jgi:signal transduction histidine kinase/ligand-binding sensor domain-containing protein
VLAGWCGAKLRRAACWRRNVSPYWGPLLVGMAILLIGPVGAGSQQGKTPDYFHHQVWSTEDGLPQASVHAILQSHEGYLWVATENGAARFDGQSFRVLNHRTVPAFASDDLCCLAEDQPGDLWFGTLDGLVRKHGEDYKRFSAQDGLPSDEILALATSASGLLVLTSGGLATWQRDHFERVATNEAITGLASGEQGPTLVSNRGGVYRWSGGQLVSLMSPAPDGQALLGAVIDKQGIWTYGSNFVQFSSSSQKKTWQTGRDLPGNRVQVLYVDAQGKAWIGTNRGLVSVETASGFHLNEDEAFRGESVLSLCLDREGDLWVGTEASGLHALQPRKFATVPGSNSEAVTTVARDSRGVMYFGTRDDGIFRAESVAVPVAHNKLTSPVILSLTAGRDDDLWAGTPDGLNHIEGGQVRQWTIADGLPDNFVRSVIVAADGTVWAGTRYGLVHIADKAVRTFTQTDGLLSESIGPLLQVSPKESGTSVLWIGTAGGLCQETNQRFRCLSSPYQTNASIITALGADRDGSLWVAMHGHGLALVADDRIVPLHAPALPAEIVGILADQNGSLWLRSTRGLFRVQIKDLRACVTDPSPCNNLKVDAYGRSDGMQSDEVAGEGIFSEGEGPNGELWFATRRGIAVTDPQHLVKDRVPPGVVITQLHVDGMALPPDTIAEIGPGHRQYSFEYAGLSLNDAAGTHYRYMLDGFDHGWIDAGTRRTAYYTNLPARQYVFRVIAANSDGVWSKDEATFRFRVLTPWYRSLWAYLLGGCLAALGIVGFVQLRVREERRRFAMVLQERTRVAREVHDTLAQDLVSVSLQVELAAQHAKAGRLGEVTEQLTQTRSLVRQALESARQSIWNLRANFSEESLPVRLAARVDAFRETKGLARLRISGEYRSASASIENEVMRIASEAISNVERHSGATEMSVELSYGADNLRLQVRDNGCGFDFGSASGMADHYGLRGLEERAALLQGHLSVESAPGQGTKVTLVAPIPAEKS